MVAKKTKHSEIIIDLIKNKTYEPSLTTQKERRNHVSPNKNLEH